MILPIEAYGNWILRQKCEKISLKDIKLRDLIENMWETMRFANGCGLAASQIGKAIKLFIVDTKSTFEALQPEERLGYFEKNDYGIFETFINAKIVSRSSETWSDYEGCLSLPEISKEVKRSWNITIEYYDSNFEKQTRTFGGYTARVIQHEYDHTEGVLYIDRINALTKKMIDGKLKRIMKGQVETKYLMKYNK
jgi:peptide deformylase